MKIEFDPIKSKLNEKNRALPFIKAADFEWETALYEEDDRKLYPERRLYSVRVY